MPCWNYTNFHVDKETKSYSFRSYQNWSHFTMKHGLCTIEMCESSSGWDRLAWDQSNFE